MAGGRGGWEGSWGLLVGVAGFADALPAARLASGPLRLRAAQCGEAAGLAAGGGRVVPAVGCGRDRRPCLSGAGGRAGDPWAGDRGAGRQPPFEPAAAAAGGGLGQAVGGRGGLRHCPHRPHDQVQLWRHGIQRPPDPVVGSVGARAIAVFGVDVARLHWDMTSISLYGVYEEVETGFAAPKWGKPKDRRPDLKQVQTGLAVSGDGGVPVWHRAFDGGAGEVAQVVGAMEGLKELAGTRKVLLVGDSKLIC